MFSVLLSLISLFAAKAQIKGKVTDDREGPVAFANVVLYSLPDSAFLAGAVTDSLGNFTLPSNRPEHAFLQVSFIGYDTKIVCAQSMQIIRLQPSSAQLDEVVVRGQRPVYKMEANGLNTNIQHTHLSRLGTANDVLSQLPFLTGEKGEFTVFGRGTPLIYINNRLVRDTDELEQLKSSEIKDIKIILNPGTEYESSVGAVVRITTLKPIGEGISGSIYTSVRQRRNFDHSEYVTLNYRKNKLDIFGRINYTRTASKQNQKDETVLNLGNQYITRNKKLLRTETSAWDATAGVNYSLSSSHAFGLRYNYKRMPKSDWDINGHTYHLIDQLNDSDFLSANLTHMESHRHYLNAYYAAEFNNKTSFHFDGDYIRGNRRQNESADYQNDRSGEQTEVHSTNATNYFLYAGKAIFTVPTANGKISAGGDASYTENDQDFKMLNEDISHDLPSTNSLSKQTLWAAFFSFEHSWQRLSIQAGMRYEWIGFKYYYNKAYKKDQSRTYGNWFPMFSAAYQDESFHMSLNGRAIVRRPTYFNLRSSISYNNPYTYEGGNPSLKPMYTYKITYLFGWKDLQAEISYHWIKDHLLFVAEQFEDQAICLLTMQNLKHSRRLDTYLGYSPTFGCWKPAWELGFYKQNLHFQEKKYNKPYYFYRWNNLFQLPGEYLFSVNMWGKLKGHSDVTFNRSVFSVDLKLNKSFLAQTLDVTLNITDIFATSREKWSMQTGKIFYDKWNDGNRRGVSLQIAYKFNASRSKYKGQGAAGSELNRL